MMYSASEDASFPRERFIDRLFVFVLSTRSPTVHLYIYLSFFLGMFYQIVPDIFHGLFFFIFARPISLSGI